MNQPMTDFDIVVLGGGSGGYATALRASQLGFSVALIEQDRLGGTCLHSGCIPTKALLHVAEVADTVRGSSLLGIKSGVEALDMKVIQGFKSGIVDRLHRGLEGLVSSASGITYVEGTGRLVGPLSVNVDGTIITGRHLVLATGSSPRSIPGTSTGKRVLTSSDALALNEIPERAVIIGGSVIGVEFASAWRSLGTEVTIVETLANLVPLEDPALSRQLERAFRKRKILFRKKTRVTGIEEFHDHVLVTLDDDSTIETDYVLVAVGRAPNTAGIGLEEAGIDLQKEWIRTDERLSTSIENVYAVGDVVEGLQLAHRGFAHGIFVAEEIAGLSPLPVHDSSIPRVTYSDPELASVGLSELQAREQFGESVTTYEYNLAGNGKSQILNTTGVVKLVKDPAGSIVGVHMVGSRISEQAGEASLIVALGATTESLSRIVHAHPTQNEALGEAILALAGKPLHSHS